MRNFRACTRLIPSEGLLNRGPSVAVKRCSRQTDSLAAGNRFAGGDAFRIQYVVCSPEVIEIMSAALAASIESLPEPVSATQVHYLAESILHSAGCGERDIAVLARIALVELRIAPRE
jgi:hypothetical protein